MSFILRHWKVSVPTVGIFILIGTASAIYAPQAAVINVNEDEEFVGDSIEVTGTAKADCTCDIHIWVNDAEVSLAENRTFHTSVPVTKDTNMNKVIITAKTTGGLMRQRTLASTIQPIYKRKAASVSVINQPLESREKEYSLTLSGAPNASVKTNDGVTKTLLDAQGNGTIIVRVNTAYNVLHTPIVLTINADGFAEGTTAIDIKNLKYDADRVAKEKAAEEKRLAEIRAKEEAKAWMRSHPLEFIEIVNNNWYMGGFGVIPIHAITLKNKGEVSYKDIKIAITYTSRSDTLIDVGTQVIYDVLPAKKTKTFREINMGFMDSQAAKSRVKIISAEIIE